MTQALLELDRQYARVIDETASEDHNEVLRTLGAGFRDRSWTRAQLVEQPQAVTVVLGEAGIGKTSEFALLEADWRRSSRFVCRLPVADLADCDMLEDLVAPDACRRWLDSTRMGRGCSSSTPSTRPSSANIGSSRPFAVFSGSSAT